MEAEAFLRLVLRARRDPSARSVLAAALPGLDWPSILDLANQERVTPLVYQVLKDQDIPSQIKSRLREIYYESARANILRFQQLEKILQVFFTHGIRVIVLKGAALAEPVYGSLALRPMTDLDLLISGEQIEEAVKIMPELGYARVEPDTPIDTGLTTACEVQFIRPDQPGSYLELHWNLLLPPYYRGRFDPAWIWQTAVPMLVGSQSTLSLSPEAALIHTCAHLCLHHFGEGLLWQNDAAELLTCCADRLDWSFIFNKAVEMELAPALQMILPLAVNELGAPAPADLLPRLAALPVSRQEQRQFLRAMDARHTNARLTWSYMLGLPGWRARLGYAFTNLFPAPAYMRQRYRIAHPLLLPFYYPYRWITGLFRRVS